MRQSRRKTKFQKKSLFWGIFPRFPFPGYVFTLCFLEGPRRPLGRPKKRHFFVRKNVFRMRQYGAFWLQRSYCGEGYHISPPTGLNLESAEISTSKLANSKQQMSKSIQEFLKCTLISSPLVRWKWPTQVRTLETLWWGWNLGPWNDAIHDFRRSVQNVCSGIWKNAVFFGPRLSDDGPKKSWLSGWLAIWLAGYLAGYLAGSLAALAGWLFGNWLCGWLAGYLAISYLVGWLIGRLALAMAVSLNGSFSGLLSGYLDGWLAIWLAGYLAGWLGGGLRAGWLIAWWFARSLAGSRFGYLAIWLAAYLPMIAWWFAR